MIINLEYGSRLNIKINITMSYVSAGLVSQVSGSVSQSAIDEISAFQTNVRSLLQGYETFLQGSYANDTAISDINDVDIIALEKPLLGFLPSISASNNLFYDIKSKLEVNQTYRGRITIGRKCLTLTLATRKADIVPATGAVVGQSNHFGEPITIAQQILNYPKTHRSNGQSKNQRTRDNYKRTVRMLKNYVNNWGIKSIAPSFYIECVVFSYTDESFDNDLVLTLNNILTHMLSNNFITNFRTVAGDKIVISQSEWAPQSFVAFRQHIAERLLYLRVAGVNADTEGANLNFRRFFRL